MSQPTRKAALARRIGARLRTLRVTAGLTQEKLAWECDLANAYLSQVEAGQRLPSVEVLDRLAERLGMQLADLFTADPPLPAQALRTRE